ncbi:MAG: thiamine biosynthesis protein ThiF [Rhodocyclales bacterium]|nr:thiamine biosynthesis protein ThiF [Rhodocyclales bacterium]
MSPDLIIQERHLTELRALLARDHGVEASAYLLFGTSEIKQDPWSKRRRRRFTSFEVLPVPPEDHVSADAQHITWSTSSYVRLLKRAEDEGLIVGIVHTHPTGPACFSEQDDRNEGELAQMARNRNGKSAELISVLLAGKDQILARLWVDEREPIPMAHLRVIGRTYRIHERLPSTSGLEHLHRQGLAFGDQLNTWLRTLRIGIVGCGGTGSATAMLLARLGVGYLALFDEDTADLTNLNRLHGSKRSDVDAMRSKVEIVAREITEAGLGVKAHAMKGWVGDPTFRDALKSCDVIFGCTDDHSGRLFLNRLAHFYLIPVIDIGLAITPNDEGGGVKDLSGRTTVVFPGAPCLMCRGIVDPAKAREEDLRRASPEEYERQKREAYVRGAGNPAPAVVTFTTSTACMAIDELLQALVGFRGPEGWAWNRLRRFDLMKDRVPGALSGDHCPICESQDYWGRGDINPFMDRVG